MTAAYHPRRGIVQHVPLFARLGPLELDDRVSPTISMSPLFAFQFNRLFCVGVFHFRLLLLATCCLPPGLALAAPTVLLLCSQNSCWICASVRKPIMGLYRSSQAKLELSFSSGCPCFLSILLMRCALQSSSCSSCVVLVGLRCSSEPSTLRECALKFGPLDFYTTHPCFKLQLREYIDLCNLCF